jgi:hypothetical protein
MADRLKDFKKTAMTADDHRRRRMDTAVNLRKEKRTEQLQKRRHFMDGATEDDEDEASSMETTVSKVPSVVRSIPLLG